MDCGFLHLLKYLYYNPLKPFNFHVGMLPEPALTIFRLTPFLLFWWLCVTPPIKSLPFFRNSSLFIFFLPVPVLLRADLRAFFCLGIISGCADAARMVPELARLTTASS